MFCLRDNELQYILSGQTTFKIPMLFLLAFSCSAATKLNYNCIIIFLWFRGVCKGSCETALAASFLGERGTRPQFIFTHRWPVSETVVVLREVVFCLC